MRPPTKSPIPPHFDKTVEKPVSDIKEVDQNLLFADVPTNILEALSEAVDKIRATNWALLNSTLDQFATSRQTNVLAAHRIQRAAPLLDAIKHEIDDGVITATTPGVEELRTLLGVVYKKLHFVTTGHSAASD